MRQHSAGQSTKQRKAARVSSFLLCGPLPVKDLCGIILDYSQHFEGKPALVWNTHTSRVTALAVLPDGKLASGSWDKTVRVWDAASGACLLTLASHTNSVSALAVLPDGKLASGSWDGTVRVWDPASGECLLTLSHISAVACMTVLQDGRLAVGLANGTIHVWE